MPGENPKSAAEGGLGPRTGFWGPFAPWPFGRRDGPPLPGPPLLLPEPLLLLMLPGDPALGPVPVPWMFARALLLLLLLGWLEERLWSFSFLKRKSPKLACKQGVNTDEDVVRRQEAVCHSSSVRHQLWNILVPVNMAEKILLTTAHTGHCICAFVKGLW